MMLAQLDRRAVRRDHLHLRRHQPHGLVSEVRVERQGCLSADPQGGHRAARDLQRGAGAQRDVPAPRLLRHRIQRAQLRVQLVVPQAPGPDREVLHARHRLEPRRVRLYPQAIPRARGQLARRRQEVVCNGDADLAGARARVRRVHHQRAAGRRTVRVQRQRAQHGPGHQPAAERLRRGAGLGQQEGAEAGLRRRAAAAVRHADQPQRADRGDGRRGRAHRRPAPGLPGHRPRSADRRRALAGRDREDGQPDVRAEPQTTCRSSSTSRCRQWIIANRTISRAR